MAPDAKDELAPKLINLWLKQQKTKSKGLLSKAVAFGSINGLVMIGQMALLAFIINGAIFDGLNFDQLTPWLLALAGVVVVRVLLGYLSERFSRRGAAHIKGTIRQELLQHLFALGPAYAQRRGQAATAQLLHQGVDSLEDYFAGYLPAVAYCAVIPLGVLALVFPFDWGGGLIFLFTAPFIPFFMILIGKRAEGLNQQHWAKLLRMSSHFLDIIQGLTQLKIFNASRQEVAAVKTISEDYRRQTMGILKVAFLSSFFLEFLASISIALVAVILGFRLYYGTMDYTLALWVLLLAPEFYLPFRNLGAQYHAKMAGVTAAKDMIELFNQPIHKEGETGTFTAPFNIELHQVDFAYQGRGKALADINLILEKTGLYALVGESGSGKSTLVDLILGFLHPAQGKVRLNGTELTGANRDAWLSHCGWIAQHGHILYGSLGFNVAMSEEYDEQAVMSALTQAGLATFVSGLSGGLDSRIGEGGAGLSGGQNQRLALARAFYHQPQVLILDEPSSHLDKDSETIIGNAISEYAKNHLVIVIAHRLHTVLDAKEIIVLSEGKVIEQGSHQALLDKNGRYAAMVNVKEVAYDQSVATA